MNNINYNLIKKLRELTGAGILDCNKALIKSNWDIKIAINNMRISGKIKILKKLNRITNEGIILAETSKNNKYGVIIELNCETDFVSRNNLFKKFGKKVVNTALNELKNKKLININILKEKLKKDRLNLISQIGENINIRRFGVLHGDFLQIYLHRSRIGVLFSSNKIRNKITKYLAMHIASNNPKYINVDDIPIDILNNEYEIQLNIINKSSKDIKSDKIIKKIIKGRMCKFINNIVLINQFFIMDTNKTVGQILNKHNIIINDFIRFELGEEIN